MRRLSGIAPVTEERLRGLGLTTIARLQDVPDELLAGAFLTGAAALKELAFGGSDDVVRAGHAAPKSMGREVTFACDINALQLMTEGALMTEPHRGRRWWDRLAPRAGVRLQLVSAAALWLVGTSFLLVRGVLFIERPGPGFHFSYAIVPIAAVAFVLGAVKARYILIGYANGAVARIERRGRACYFGFFAPRSWLFVAVMMGGGLWLRHSALVDVGWGRVALSTLYLAVGTGLALADRIFWLAAFRAKRMTTRAP